MRGLRLTTVKGRGGSSLGRRFNAIKLDGWNCEETYLTGGCSSRYMYRGHMILEPASATTLHLNEVQERSRLRTTYKILIADDSDEDAALLLSSLREAGSEVVSTNVRDGDELLQLLSSDAGSFCLAVIDFHLPRRDAGEVIATLQQTRGLPACPVVVLSSFISPQQQRTLLANGVRGIHTKPGSLSGYAVLASKLVGILGENENAAAL